jgi:hypothetical protein
MLNSDPRTGSTTHPGSHAAKVVPGPDNGIGSGAPCRDEGAPLGDTSRDPTSHPGTHRSRRVTSTSRRLEPWPLAPGEVAGAERARMAPASGGGPRSATVVSRRSRDMATALQWLREGAPIQDVRKVVEVRRRFELSPEFARQYATNIVHAAAKRLRAERLNPSREEIIHAVA